MKKRICLLVLCVFLSGRIFAQDMMTAYVIVDKLLMYESPTLKAKQLREFNVGAKIYWTGEGSSSTETVQGVNKEIYWSKISFQGQEGWIFSEGICERFLPAFFSQPLDTDYSGDWVLQMKESQAIVKALIDQNVLKLDANTLKFRAKNGKEILVRESICQASDAEQVLSDGHSINFIQRNAQNPSLIEIMMGMVAFDMKCYINLDTGKKFNFPDSNPCSVSAVSPSGKYILGVDIQLEQVTLDLFDFDSQKLLKQIKPAGYNSYIIQLNWIDDQTTEVLEIDEEGEYLPKKTLRIDL